MYCFILLLSNTLLHNTLCDQQLLSPRIETMLVVQMCSCGEVVGLVELLYVVIVPLYLSHHMMKR